MVPLILYNDICDGNIELGKTEKDQEQFKLDLNEITKDNRTKNQKIKGKQ